MSETSFSKQTASLAKTFMFRGFDPEEWARSLSAQSDGDKDLIEKREKIRSLNDETCLKEMGSKDPTSAILKFYVTDFRALS